jgi:hypothetical protein
MSYPKFLYHLQKDTYTEIFSLTSEDTKLIERVRSNKNILGFAVLLKSFQYLGYPPFEKSQIPVEVVELIGYIPTKVPKVPQLFRKGAYYQGVR